MPNEPRNKTGRTLKEQLKAAADATAAEQSARKNAREQRKRRGDGSAKRDGDASTANEKDASEKKKGSAHSSRRKRKESKESAANSEQSREHVTKRHASREQVSEERKLEREASRPKDGFHPIKAAIEIFGNMGLGYRIVTCIVAFILIVGVVLYPIGCTYYQAMRQQQQLQAVLDAVNDRNSQIESENKELETDEGVENQARQEYGWVKDGEHATVITNGDDSSGNDMPSQVDETKIEPPHTWYYDILDVIFQSKV